MDAAQIPRLGPDDAFISDGAFISDARALSGLRARIADAARREETSCVPPLVREAAMDPQRRSQANRLARDLAQSARARSRAGVSIGGLLQEFSLSSDEGTALMCLAEALLRIPDAATRDALIRDKIAERNWAAHIGHGRSLFVNAAAWGLLLTGKVLSDVNAAHLSGSLSRVLARGGEPIVRAGVDYVMRHVGEQFVLGDSIETAIARARQAEAQGYSHSYDMLGEAALTAADAARYFKAYAHAIESLGASARDHRLHDNSMHDKPIYERAGVSIKLSALHPRYGRSQRARVAAELFPAIIALTRLARDRGVGVNLDAEECDKLDLSLDAIEALCADPHLAGWDGIGFVVQAYQKRAPPTVDFLIDLARRSGHRLMLRLVKGAYWDSEINRAQIDGLDFPVFTRKIHTDVCYLACARRMLDARAVVFPQFATHNAQTIAAIHTLAGSAFQRGD